MKKMRMRLTTAVLAVCMATTMAMTSFAAGWQQDANGRWWWQNPDGTWPASTWAWLDGNGDGVAESYCFDTAGYLYTNTTTPDGYTVNGDGAWTVNGTVQTQKSNSTVQASAEPIYIGQIEMNALAKSNGKYVYSGILYGYDESRVTADGDWTEGFYEAASGTYYVDDATKIVIDTEASGFGNYGFPAAGKTAVQWLDDFMSRREGWMILEFEVQGSHVNVIHGIYSVD